MWPLQINTGNVETKSDDNDDSFDSHRLQQAESLRIKIDGRTYKAFLKSTSTRFHFFAISVVRRSKLNEILERRGVAKWMRCDGLERASRETY